MSTFGSRMVIQMIPLFYMLTFLLFLSLVVLLQLTLTASVLKGVEVTSKSPSAKRPKMSENQISFDSPNVRKKHVLEDISNFRPVSDFAAKATCLSQMSQPDSRILNRIPGN